MNQKDFDIRLGKLLAKAQKNDGCANVTWRNTDDILIGTSLVIVASRDKHAERGYTITVNDIDLSWFDNDLTERILRHISDNM